MLSRKGAARDLRVGVAGASLESRRGVSRQSTLGRTQLSGE